MRKSIFLFLLSRKTSFVRIANKEPSQQMHLYILIFEAVHTNTKATKSRIMEKVFQNKIIEIDLQNNKKSFLIKEALT